jgi:transaldolase
VRYNASDIEVTPRIGNPVDEKIVDTLLRKFPDFERAYTENGLTHEEFDTFGSTRRTLRQFIAACAELNGVIRDVMLPDPDSE